MTTRIGPVPTTGGIALLETATRVTPDPAHPFGAVLRSGAQAVLRGAEGAVAQLPGGQFLAAAVRQPVDVGAAAAGQTSSAGAATSPTLSSATTATTGEGGGIEAALAKQAEDNLYYLGLQQQIQDENRYFTTVSNVLKARHDTVKNSISNLR